MIRIMNPQDLSELRIEIDALDNEIVELLVRRFDVSKRILEAKLQTGMAVHDPAREDQVLKRLTQKLEAYKETLTPSALRTIYASIMQESRAAQSRHYVSVLGPEGSHTQMAAIKNGGFGQKFILADSIAESIQLVADQSAGEVVAPIENSLGGSVGETIDAIWRYRVKVGSELRMPIRQSLLGTGPLSKVRYVYSHPQALAQCNQWLRQNLPNAEICVTTSTSKAAQHVKNKADAVAIASELASHIYKLPVLANDIQDDASNQTRFFVLYNRQTELPAADTQKTLRAGTLFTLPHRSGALAKVLQVIESLGFNLTYIVSRPVSSTPWEYVFFLEYEVDGKAKQYPNLVASILEYTVDLHNLGVYNVIQL